MLSAKAAQMSCMAADKSPYSMWSAADSILPSTNISQDKQMQEKHTKKNCTGFDHEQTKGREGELLIELLIIVAARENRLLSRCCKYVTVAYKTSQVAVHHV